ncbi:MAG TPA: glycoside hydrolase family 15 protein [Kofleriaceae bacterium]
MASRIENYGLISNMRGAALVARNGSIDWLCLPRFDSDACMAALLGRDEHGCWTIDPAADIRHATRRYRPGTMILETELACVGGRVRIVDFMPLGRNAIVRVVEGLDGSVPVDLNLVARFGYGHYHPWLRQIDGDVVLTSAPDALVLRSSARLDVDEHDVRGVVTVNAGDRLGFELSWFPASQPPPPPLDWRAELERSERLATDWISRSTYRGPYRDAVNRSLITLKAMIYEPSGGIVAAPTAALPEEIGGVRNWDYRFCWLRDATLTLDGLMVGGYTEEARAWRNWLLNAVAGAPDQVQIMYGIDGERRLTEFEVPWLPGYEESRPVRNGNAASEQFQLDVYGEVLQALYEARRLGLPEEESAIGPGIQLMEFVASAWQLPDDGIWEVRGGRRHFVHSKVMAWVAVDRFVRLVEDFFPRDAALLRLLPRYRALRERIHDDVLEHGFDAQQNAFVQAYNSSALDASVLLIPALGFLPADDPRVQGTIRAIERKLVRDGFVLRYQPEHTQDGLAGAEGAFLACSFWLVDAYAYSGRRRDAEALFEHLLSLRNDLGLLSEEFEPRSGRLIGNFPQAFSHLALVHSASVLADAELTPRSRPDARARSVA